MRALRHLWTLVVLVPLSGCIVFVPSYDPLDNCPINGESLCGTCIRTNCQAEVNACCGSVDCRTIGYGLDDELGSTVSALDDCAAGSGCEAALETAHKSAEGSAVNTCVASKCQAACAVKAAISKWTCDSPAGVDECSTCIFSKCGAPMTTCCSGERSTYTGCQADLQGEMSSCTTGDAAGCASMATGSSTGQSGVVRSCVAKSCASKCFGNGHRHQSCSLEGGGAYCTCRDEAVASGDDCSTAALPNSRCFFTKLGCVCGHYACAVNDSSVDSPKCSCGLQNETTGTGPASECNPQSIGLGGFDHDQEATCCLTPGDPFTPTQCTCDTLSTSCYPPAFEVFSCDKASFLSALADVATDTCSQ